MRMFSVTLSFEGHEWIEIVKAFDTLEAIRKAKLNAECLIVLVLDVALCSNL